MINMQMIVAIFLAAVVPTVTTLIGILMNRSESASIRSDLSGLRAEIAGIREGLARVEEKIGIAG